jgi:uncharacterized Fe-S center protein
MAGRAEVQVASTGIPFRALELASLDLIDKAPLVVGATDARPPDLLGKMHGTSSLTQLRVAEKLGMGSMDYELSRV